MPVATPRFGQSPEDCSIVLQNTWDDVPKLPAQTLVLFRNTKPAQAFGSDDLPVVIAVKHEKSHTISGVAKSVAVTTIVDQKDHFDALPATIKKSFRSSQDIKNMMGVDGSCKLYAVVCEEYQPRGPFYYELSITKQRLGFGKGTIHHVPAQSSTKEEKTSFFAGTKRQEPQLPKSEPVDSGKPSDVVLTQDGEAVDAISASQEHSKDSDPDQHVQPQLEPVKPPTPNLDLFESG